MVSAEGCSHAEATVPSTSGWWQWLSLGQCSAQGRCPRSSPRYSDHTLWTAFLGLHDQSKRSASGVQELGLKRIISHPYFNDFTFDYDIALLELEQPAEYSSTVRPICLPEASHTFPTGKAIWVTGWGHTQEGGELAGLATGGLPTCLCLAVGGCPKVKWRLGSGSEAWRCL